jgi:hypothetical protein
MKHVRRSKIASSWTVAIVVADVKLLRNPNVEHGVSYCVQKPLKINASASEQRPVEWHAALEMHEAAALPMTDADEPASSRRWELLSRSSVPFSLPLIEIEEILLETSNAIQLCVCEHSKWELHVKKVVMPGEMKIPVAPRRVVAASHIAN